MNSLGIYFGPKVISIVETKGKKIINNTRISQSTISASGEIEEKVPAEVKTIGIVALFKEELRKNRIEAKDATYCLSGKDLIIRSFEMPMMPRDELQSAVNFEVKKYIPFRVEDLVSDFQVMFDKVSRTNLILFMGIKKETLDKYISISDQLNIKIRAIEYSAFSVLRCLKLAGTSVKGVIGVLGIDFNGEDEINFTVLENGFPLFSRDIVLGGVQGGEFQKVEEVGLDKALEKLKTEIRVSLDYYHRKFPTKNTKKIFLFSSHDYRSELEAIMTEIGLTVRFVDLAKNIDRSIPYSLSFIKGYSVSLSRAIKTNLKLNLLAAKEKTRIAKAKIIQPEALPLLKSLKSDYRVVALALLICIASFSLGIYRILSLRQELDRTMSEKAQFATISPAATFEELTGATFELKKKLNNLDNLIEKQLYLTEPLNVIARVMPKGSWLTELSFQQEEEGRAELVLDGLVYLAESEQEFAAVNQFISDLRENPNFAKYFKNINIVSIDRKQVDEITATGFYISCKTY